MKSLRSSLLRQLFVPESKPSALSAASQAAQPEHHPHQGLEQLTDTPPLPTASTCVTPVSPSTDAEYDKLLVRISWKAIRDGSGEEDVISQKISFCLAFHSPHC